MGGRTLVSPCVERVASCELRPYQSAPVDMGHVVQAEPALPDRAEPCRRGAGEPAGTCAVDCELKATVDVQPPSWPQGDGLRHGIVDCRADRYRSAVMPPPTSESDDSI